MAVIAIYSVKGGVGKTTLAADMAYRCAAIGGHPTLLWDLDPQGGSGFLYQAEERRVGRAASLFHREGRPRDLIEKTRFDRLDLLQSDESLRSLPLQFARIGHRTKLANLIALLRARYRRIVLDCPPMMNEVSEQIVAAADVIVSPVTASPLARRALEQVRDEVKRGGRGHPPILPVLSMYDVRRRKHREVKEGEASAWPVIPQSSLVEQAAWQCRPLPEFANWSEASRALGRLYSGVEVKMMELGRF